MLRIFSLMLQKVHLVTDQNINESQQKSGNEWFQNKECVKSRRNYRKAKRHYYKLKSDNNKKALSDALKAYKKTIKLQKKNYNKLFCKKLKEIKAKDPKLPGKFFVPKRDLK